MMNKVRKAWEAAALAALLLTSASCESIYDDEGDCSSNWYVQFLYTDNRQAVTSLNGVGPDAFAQSVPSVHLYVFDAATGEPVYEDEAWGDVLATGNYLMPLDLQPGRYDIVAWCGLRDTLGAASNAFVSTVKDRASAAGRAAAGLTPSVTDRSELGFSVRRDAKGDSIAWHGDYYTPLFYGQHLGVEITDAVGHHTIPVSLTKNTNELNVSVELPDNDEYSCDDLEVVFIADNATIDDRNRIQHGDTVVYKAHHTFYFDTEAIQDGDTIKGKTLNAHIATARLTTDLATREHEARLVVRFKDGSRDIFSLPFVTNLLEMRGYKNNIPDDQRYLDCEDYYTCQIYFAASGADLWVTSIRINNWVVVPPQHEGF